MTSGNHLGIDILNNSIDLYICPLILDLSCPNALIRMPGKERTKVLTIKAQWLFDVFDKGNFALSYSAL
jgi:hypothetical protein